MLWRKLKLDWKYALGELVIVTAGVLIALAIDQWNDNRLDLERERQIIRQIIQDLDTDIQNVTYAEEGLKRKEVSLLRLQDSLNATDSTAVNGRQLLEDVVIGANFGWNQGRPQSASFDEVRSSGRFSLIGDFGLRKMTSNYYMNWQDYGHRSDERETDYPSLSYLLVPRRFITDTKSNISQTATGQVGILQFDPNTPADQIEDLVRAVKESNIASYVTGELNFARFVQVMMADIRNDAVALRTALDDYLSSLDH